MTKPVVCLDLDGVLATYTGWRGIEHIGEPIQGAVAFTRQLSKFCKIVIYTTRCKEYPQGTESPPGAQDVDRRPAIELVMIVREWLDRHGFSYDEIYFGQGKPFAVAYIDDRAITCQPQETHTPEFEYQYALAAVATLVDKLRPRDTSAALKET